MDMKLSSPLIPDSVSAAPSSHQPGKPTRSKKTNAAGTSHRTWRAVDMMSVVPVVTVFDLTVMVAIVTVLASGVGDIGNRSSEKSAGYGNDFCESYHYGSLAWTEKPSTK